MSVSVLSITHAAPSDYTSAQQHYGRSQADCNALGLVEDLLVRRVPSWPSTR